MENTDNKQHNTAVQSIIVYTTDQSQPILTACVNLMGWFSTAGHQLASMNHA
eukprot:m.18763 g.18763  ORF g.18763 m.18763 type:complete len:52 (-) comp7941_c0_seq1:36-191(-)